MDEELKAYLEEMKQGIVSELSERIEKVETNILRAFHDWSRPYEMRVRNALPVVSSFDERFSLMEERVSELERKTSLGVLK